MPAEFPEEKFDFGQDFQTEEQVVEPEYAKEGIYHLSLQEVDVSGEAFPGAAFLTFEILAGNVAGQEGKNVRYPVWPPHPNAKNQEMAKRNWKKTILRLMLALGIRKAGEFPKATINRDWWGSLQGKQCVGRVTHKEQSRDTEDGRKITFITATIAKRDDLCAIGSDEVKGVPLNDEAAQIGGYLEASMEEDV